jgi:hypothetical protein
LGRGAGGEGRVYSYSTPAQTSPFSQMERGNRT